MVGESIRPSSNEGTEEDKSQLSRNESAEGDTQSNRNEGIGKAALEATSTIVSESSSTEEDKERAIFLRQECLDKVEKISSFTKNAFVDYIDSWGNFDPNYSEGLKRTFIKEMTEYYTNSNIDLLNVVEHHFNPQHSSDRYRTTDNQKTIYSNNAQKRDNSINKYIEEISRTFYPNNIEANRILAKLSKSAANEKSFAQDFEYYLEKPDDEALKSLKDNCDSRTKLEIAAINALLDLNPQVRPDSLSNGALTDFQASKDGYLDSIINYVDFRREHPGLYKTTDRPELPKGEFL